MSTYRYLIVGGGIAADAAVHGLRELDADGTIAMFCAEEHPPYNRPPLSKGLWKGDSVTSLRRDTDAAGMATILGHRVVAIEPSARSVTVDSGDTHHYEKLLLATGVTPRRLPFGGDSIVYYRNLDDYERVRDRAQPGSLVVVIGGGFIGSEIAAGLAMTGCKVTLLFPEPGIGSRIYPADLSAHLVDYYRQKGIDVQPSTEVSDVTTRGDLTVVSTKEGAAYDADVVIAGVGARPEVALAQEAGIAVDNGIIVDEHLATSAEGVYAAGDVAGYFSPQLGKRIRVEHEDNALTMGRAAGRAMAGDTAPYEHLPFFYSDLFELGYEAVGETDTRHEVVIDWKRSFEEGVLYYLNQGRVRGVLLWGIFGKVDQARDLIADPGPWTATALMGRIEA